MVSSSPSPDRIVRRIVAEGTLQLLSAAHLGGGETRGVDMALLAGGDGAPFLPGSTTAGCLRSYLAQRLLSRRAFESAGGIRAEPELLRLLFGDAIDEDSDTAEQSLLIVDDVFLNKAFRTDVRDSVRIDAITGTARDGAKFDFEVLDAGASGTLRLELVLRERHSTRQDELVQHFQAALDALASGRLRLGAKTRRGLGRVRVAEWRIRDYQIGSSRADAIAWLRNVAPPAGDLPRLCPEPDLLQEPARAVPDLVLRLDGSLLVRSATRETVAGAPDVEQFRSGGDPVVPGTSWAGVLRSRALRIVNTLEIGAALVTSIFGPSHDAPAGQRGGGLRASRLSVEEAAIDGVEPRPQSRIRIDRFTGGVTSGGLFAEAAVWPKPATRHGHIRLHVELLYPEPDEVALLLLLAKDLWSSDLTAGGGWGIGRGVLLGEDGRLTTPDGAWHWLPAGEAGAGELRFDEGDPAELERIYFTRWREPLEVRHAPDEDGRAAPAPTEEAAHA